MFVTRYSLILLGGLIATQSSFSHAAVNAAFEKEHKRAISLAHEDKPHQAIAILNKLLKKDPGNKAVYQDLIIFTAWTGDCDKAITMFKKIENIPKPNPWMIGPVAECMAQDDAEKENALRLVQQNLSREPEHEELLNVQKQLTEDIRIARMHEVRGEFNSVNTDQGTQGPTNVNAEEWKFKLKYTHTVSPMTKVYARSLTVRAQDPIATAELNRIGFGIQQRLTNQFAISQEFSVDTERDDEEASLTTLYYFPNRFWSFNLAYATFSEDLPLRGLAIDPGNPNRLTGGSKLSLNADYHTWDYSIFWLGSISTADYDDGNKPKSLFTEIEYRFAKKNRMEHRAVAEFSYADNTPLAVNYYNPDDASSLVAGYRFDYDYKTRFKNHIDQLYAYYGFYSQANFDTKPVYGIRFKQDYAFTKRSSLGLQVDLRSSVFDGNRETQVGLGLVYRHKL